MGLTGIWPFLLGYNLVVFGLYGWDKANAVHGHRRIRESTLLWLAVWFGAPGALLAVWTLRHKSRKPKFTLGIALLLLVQLLFWAWATAWQ